MSTKIYNGKILNIENTPYALNQFYLDMRRKAVPLAQKQFFKLVAQTAQDLYYMLHHGNRLLTHYSFKMDDIRFSNDPASVLDAAVEIVKRMIEQNRISDRWINCEREAELSFSIGIFPLTDKILAIPFLENDIYTELVENDPTLISYPYWNNTDPPEDISYEDWKAIGREWDKAIPGPGSTRDYGFTMKIVDPAYDIRAYVAKKRAFAANFLAEHLLPDKEMKIWAAKRILSYNKLSEVMGNWDSTKREVLRMSMTLDILKYYDEHKDEVEKYIREHFNFPSIIEFFSQLP